MHKAPPAAPTPIYEAPAYAPEGAPSYWRQTVELPPAPLPLEGVARTQVAVIGAGYTGLNAALEVAERGGQAVVLDAHAPGWGASGRNGGFACLGGAKLSAAQIAARVGAEGLAEWQAHERAAVARVADNLQRYRIAADPVPAGELCLAHSPRAFRRMAREAGGEVIDPATLAARGLGSPAFHGGVLCPTGFALNPLKYVLGLAGAAEGAGVRICAHSPATALIREGPLWRVVTPRGSVLAERVVLATNGYVTEALAPPLAGTALPVISAILVTREMQEAEFAAQGWTARLMAYDSRHLLHYFRRLPENRFLFGMRGAISAHPRAIAAMRARQRAELARMFPAWAGVETPHFWWGLACVTRRRAPFCGPVPGMDGVFAAFGWHGNGVSAGTAGGRLAGQLALGAGPATVPALMRTPPARFPLPRFRRLWLAAAYLGYALADRLS